MGLTVDGAVEHLVRSFYRDQPDQAGRTGRRQPRSELEPFVTSDARETSDMRARSVILASLLLVAAIGPAAAQAPHGHHGSAPSKADAPSTRDFKAADAKMMKDMAVPYTGDPDVDFRAHMIPHHEGAIAMARVALAHAKDPDSKVLAETIIKDQEREIAEMRAWLKARGK